MTVNTSSLDVRESLANEGRQGPAHDISLSADQITTVRGIMFDHDPGLLAPNNPVLPPSDDIDEFFRRLGPILLRHPLAQHAEVRDSGTGLHGILWLDPPLELHSTADQEYWANVIGTVQQSLPVDVNAPTITALTRPVGETNTKNGRQVRRLRPGRPVAPAEVEAFALRVAESPFREIVTPLFGSKQIAPCPICRAPDSKLDVLDHVGKCYGCGKIKLDQIFDVIFAAKTLSRIESSPPSAGTSLAGQCTD